MSVIVKWDGEEVPEELWTLPKGRYVLIPVDDVPELTPEQEAGIEAALASVRAGDGVSRDEARKRVDTVLGR